MQHGIGQHRSAVSVEQDVGRRDRTVREPRAMELVHRLGQWREQGDELSSRQRTATVEQRSQTACHDVLTDQDPGGAGLAEVEQAGKVRMADALQNGKIVTKLLLVGEQDDRKAFEYGVPAGSTVADLPDGAG